MQATTLVREFVTGNLSPKSQQYIQNDLLPHETEVSRMLSYTLNPKDEGYQDVIIGQLEPSEIELYVVMQSLFLRIQGTEKRIKDTPYVSIYASDSEINKLRQQYEERHYRLSELYTDLKHTRNLFNYLIISRLKENIEYVLGKNPELIKTMYHSYKSGYVFKVVDGSTIILANEYIMGGD